MGERYCSTSSRNVTGCRASASRFCGILASTTLNGAVRASAAGTSHSIKKAAANHFRGAFLEFRSRIHPTRKRLRVFDLPTRWRCAMAFRHSEIRPLSFGQSDPTVLVIFVRILGAHLLQPTHVR